LVAIVRPTIRDIAWAAGIYEGEGTCYRKEGHCQVRVIQKDRWMPERMRDLFGGGVTPFARAKGLSKDYLAWNASGARARGFLQTIFPLLSPRRQTQALKAMGHS
jgi:hypothetical protein